MDEQAITPNADDLTVMDDSEVVETEAIDDAHQSEVELASLNSTRGWQRIATKMQSDIDGLRTGSKLDFKPDTALEIIGQKYLIASLVAAHLQQYMDMVSGAQKATVEYEARKHR